MKKGQTAAMIEMKDFPETLHLDLKKKQHKVPKLEIGEEVAVTVRGKLNSFREDEDRFSVGLEIQGVSFEGADGSLSDQIRKKQSRQRGGGVGPQ